MAGFIRSRNGGSGGGGLVRRAPVPRPVAAPAPRSVTSASTIRVVPKADFRSHYDPSRVVDLDRLKIVKDMRAPQEFASERGETTDADPGQTGPGSTSGAFATPTRGTPLTPGTPTKGGGGLLLAALAAALLLGG